MLLHQSRTFAHHVVVAALLVPERLLQLLGVLAGLFETRLDICEAGLGLLLLLDDLDCGLPLAPARELAGLALFDGQGLLLCDSIVGEHLLVGHRAGRGDLKLLQVLKFILDGVLEQYLRVALLDPGEKPPEETANSPRKSSHLCRPPPAVVTPAKSVVDYIIGTWNPLRGFQHAAFGSLSARSGFAFACQPAASLRSAASQHFSQVVLEPPHERRTRPP